MQTISFKEDHISQIPALQMLIKLGYNYLTPQEALDYRQGKTSNVILEEILRKQLKIINTIQISSKTNTNFTDTNIENGILALKNVPFNEGYISATEYVYDLLTLGKTLEQTNNGDKKSFNLKYVDWDNVENNVFHVSEEFSVMRTGSKEHYRPDIVLFVNGIPFCVIECKRPDMKDPLVQAVSQHIRNQQSDGIRNLYVYSQINLSLSSDDAAYGTAGTPEKFWGKWKEKFASKNTEDQYIKKISILKNTKLASGDKDRLFADRFKYVRNYFDNIEKNSIFFNTQDEYLFNLCNPNRLLQLVFGFIVYDNNVKKIARYQQYFSIVKTIDRISVLEQGKRNGGVIWHTQGSGKSLTMVMLAQAIANVKTIRNPKIIIVTDRTDLDKQISDTFKKCGRIVNRSTTGKNLTENLEDNSDAIITTVINKFVAAIKTIKNPLISHDIFVLIDEGHRTQYGTFNVQMQKTLPNACFIAMTGTPLMKKEKSTARKFGGIIDSYTVDQAVKDKAVVPLLYEGRYVKQTLNENIVDMYFSRISENLSDKQKADLKKKFSRADQLNITEQKVFAISWDISLHYRDNWQGTGFKAQLVCQNKIAAIKYKNYLDEIGIVSSEVIISPPDDREGEDDVYEKSPELVKRYWETKMNEFGNQRKYEETTINKFKNTDNPEIIIVVDKLLTGFDEPKNVVLYLTRNLRGHTLLQAIARVNRVCDNKEFGYIIDYYGVLGELDSALGIYSSFDGFEKDEIENTMININLEIEKLPQKHSELWDIFKTVINKSDLEAFQQILRDESIRDDFYIKLREFGKILKIAMSTVKFYEDNNSYIVEKYKKDLDMFLKLRHTVASRFSDEIDYKRYEGQIQKLLDSQISCDEVRVVVNQTNIFETDKFQEEISKLSNTASKADTIATRTSRFIHAKIDEDPAFYKKFSQMLKEVMTEYELHRISEGEYLSRVTKIMEKVLSHDDEFPSEVKDSDFRKAIYGLCKEFLSIKILDIKNIDKIGIFISIEAENIISNLVIVNWQNSFDVINKIKLQLFDLIYDEIKMNYDIDITMEEIDLFVDKCIGIAKLKY